MSLRPKLHCHGASNLNKTIGAIRCAPRYYDNRYSKNKVSTNELATDRIDTPPFPVAATERRPLPFPI
jgi:hypothetical protein